MRWLAWCQSEQAVEDVINGSNDILIFHQPPCTKAALALPVAAEVKQQYGIADLVEPVRGGQKIHIRLKQARP